MKILSKINKFAIIMAVSLFGTQSCTTIESTVDSTWDSISEAGDYIYDSVNFWEEDEPEQNEAIVIEEAVEVIKECEDRYMKEIDPKLID